MSVYLKDVWTRLPELMAQITSTFGSILKIDLRLSESCREKLRALPVGQLTSATRREKL